MRYAFVCLLAIFLSACVKPPVNRTDVGALPTAEAVDLNRYAGLWYEIARFPNEFERDCEGVTAEYGFRDDGLISVLNTCRKGAPDGPAKTANGRARIVDADSKAKLQVSFFGPFWGDYWILYLADDYSLSIVGEPSGRYLWILSREPAISEKTKAEAIRFLQSIGYNTDALYFTEQPPSPSR